MNKVQVLDVFERVVWTALQIVGADAIVNYLGWDVKYIPLVAVVLAVIKNALATKFGNGTASTLPASLEPMLATPSSDGVAATITTLPAPTPAPEGPSNVTGP